MTKPFIAHSPKARAPKAAPSEEARPRPAAPPARKPKEIDGPEGPEPTRYGDWERKGICVDF